MPDSKSWGGQFNTMSPPIQKLGGICPPNPPPRDAPVICRDSNWVPFAIFIQVAR